MIETAAYAFIFEKETMGLKTNLMMMGHSQESSKLIHNKLATFNKIVHKKHCTSTSELKSLFDARFNIKSNNPLKSGYLLTYDMDKIKQDYNEYSEIAIKITLKYSIVHILNKYTSCEYLSKTYSDWINTNRQIFLNNKRLLKELIDSGYVKMYEIVNIKYKNSISYDLVELKLNNDLTLGNNPSATLIDIEDVAKFKQATLPSVTENNKPRDLSDLNKLLKIEATLQDKTSEELIQSLISDKAKKIYDLFQ